jgi:tetratricopeptide (TPR) repeat protein
MGLPVFALILLLLSSSGRVDGADVTSYREHTSRLIADHDYTAALAEISQGLTLAPTDNRLLLNRAIALHGVAQYKTSLDVLKSLAPSAESRFYMGLDCRATGDHKSAQTYLNEARELGLKDPYALYSLIEEDHALGDKTAGLSHYRAFVNEYPDSPWLHVLYANAYAQKEKDVEARKEYEAALQMNPDLPAVNFRLGYLFYKDGEYASAADYFRKEVKLNPSYADANMFLGQALHNLGREDEAIGYLRKSIALDGRWPSAYRALVAALGSKLDLEAAVEVLRTAERQFPEDASFPAQLASLLTRLNRSDEALREQERFRALQSTNASKERVLTPRP